MAYKEILLPWDRQPQGERVRPHQRWLDKGLVYADLLTDPRNTVTDSGDTVTGTKVATAPWGLSRGFGTTVGVASTDRIQTTLSTHPVQRTWILRNVRTGTGGGNLGRFFDVSAVFLLDDNSTSRYQFGRAASSVNGFWQIAFPANGVPGVVAVSYDETTGLSAVPSMYLDGIKRTLLAATQPTGTLTAKTGSFVVGNSSAGNRNYNGRLSDFLVFDSILSDGEIAELADPSRVWEDRRIWVPVSAGGGGVTVGRADEIDTALALPAKAIRATGLASETSAALALAGTQIRAVGRADESDSAFARVAVQIAATGRSDEADSAIARAAVQIKATGRADETDTSLALAATQIASTGQASETDAALALAPVQARAVGMATETDSALGLVAKQIGATGRADETDTAFARDAGSASQVGIANEIDSAISRPAVQIAPVQMATESDTALALSAPVGGQAGLSVETDTALARGAVQIRPVGLAIEADAALALGIAIVRPVGMAAENDSAFALAGRHLRLVGMASETDVALALTPPVVAPESATRGYTARSSGVRRTARSNGITRTARRRSA